MATEAWQSTRDALTVLFKGKPEDLGEIEAVAASLSDARDDSAPRRDALPVVESRLSDLLEKTPGAEAALRDYVTKSGSATSERPRIEMTGKARDEARIYQQGYGVQHNG